MVSTSFDVADWHLKNVLVPIQRVWKPLPASENLMEKKNSYGRPGIYGAGKKIKEPISLGEQRVSCEKTI